MGKIKQSFVKTLCSLIYGLFKSSPLQLPSPKDSLQENHWYWHFGCLLGQVFNWQISFHGLYVWLYKKKTKTNKLIFMCLITTVLKILYFWWFRKDEGNGKGQRVWSNQIPALDQSVVPLCVCWGWVGGGGGSGDGSRAWGWENQAPNTKEPRYFKQC